MFLAKNKTYIIAEIGNNHEGCINNAKKLIREASLAGADAVKFQTFKTKNFIHKDHPSFKRLSQFELSQKQFLLLKKYAENLNIEFISTPFDFESAIFLSKICKFIKISSGDNNFYDLIDFFASKKKNLIISTGLINFIKIKKIVNFIIKKHGKKYLNQRVSFLHCVSNYPVKKEEANLLSIKYLINKFKKKIKIGYSDHVKGILPSLIAVSLGAQIIEKHFTLSNDFSNFRDHKLSLNPSDMKKMVSQIRDIEIMMGKYQKKISKNEKKMTNFVRRSIFVNKTIKKNELFTKDNILFLRSLNKKKTKLEKIILKKKSKKNYIQGQVILN